MTTENNPTATYEDLILTRVFNAPRALVFKAWTDPKQLAQWWGPHGFTNPRCEVDPRPNGSICIDMQGPDGKVYPMRATYQEVVEPERLVFKGGALGPDGKPIFEILNTVTFEEEKGRTRLTMRADVLSMTPAATKHLEGQEIGWSQSLERFGSYVAMESATEANAADREIVVSRVFDAPREMVWEAMADPKQVAQWWGPFGFTTTIEEMDLRPGGTWKLVMHGPDGTDYPNLSVFTEVVRPERIAYSHGGARPGGPEAIFEATWTFEALEENKTRLTMRSVFPTAEARETIVREYGALQGGKQTFARLWEKLAAAQIVIEHTFNAPADLVWKALTEKERMKEWYFDLEEFIPQPGFEFQFLVEHEGTRYLHLCKVTEVITGKKLAYTWRYEGHEGNSLVTFELFPEGANTRLRLTHKGTETFPKLPDYARGNFTKGWTMLIGTSLPDYLKGQTTPTR